MERASSIPRSIAESISSISSISKRKDEGYLLPLPVRQQPKIRVRTLLGHCLYRRVIIWSVAILSLICLTLFTSGVHKTLTHGVMIGDTSKHGEEEEKKGPQWLQHPHLDGYFAGLKAIVPMQNYTPEYPRKDGEKSPYPITVADTGAPTPTPFVPQPGYKSREYKEKYHEVKTCYIDKGNKVPAPDTYAYNGVPQGQPEAVIGSHKLLGLRDDVCFDRFGRYGPYGLGYSLDEGGVQEGMDTEQEGAKEVWSKTGKINYNNVDWGDAQGRCYESNKERFLLPEDSSENPDSGKKQQTLQHDSERRKISRTAVVIRTYTGFQWTQHVILNFRAMISEVSLRSGGEYAVHFLLHVRDDDKPIWADAEVAQKVLDDNVPHEFHGLCTLWSEAQMRLLYPGRFGGSVENPSNGDIHGVYRSAHFPLQHFATTHPQYEHFWNWEMDIRWLGNYYELFDRMGVWGRQQSRVEMWERAQKYYVPHLHGSWENFTGLVHNETEASGRRAIFGPLLFAGRQELRSEDPARGGASTFLPPTVTCSRGSSDMALCGVGEDADLITLNPIFDTENSGWVFAQDVTGYDPSFDTPPRRCAIVTASRLSRRLLEVMHEETWRLHHGMFSEMFPASMALHHGLKAVYAPHPVYLDRAWDLHRVDAAFNGGRDHSTSGHGSPFDLQNEHNHKGTSWYYNSEFAGLLWRRWLGYPQMDGRGENGGRSGEGTLRGGRQEEEDKEKGTGRMCLRSMLVHPIKREGPNESH
ncbi:hypothetical protein QBC46DRAFT_6724 [Diplogelasinospora grovesii]|uniref:Major facilitator superfamily transporter n=1 Tax=Diplogelasinospora grovesii TaxID=303347 RepID=A0AAN6S877_9PEZI|nr:hypothetical protein QBC46DRAFT_6724 [Diplogelasinospora grovesii]